MSNTFRISLLTATVLFSASALSALPQGYPAEYQKVVDAATKEGKVVIYSTTDIKAAGPLIQGFEKTYPGIQRYEQHRAVQPFHQRTGLRWCERRRGLELIHGHRSEARHRLRHGVQISGAKPAAEMGGLER